MVHTLGYTKGYTFAEKSPLISLGYTLGYRKGYMVYPRMKLFFSQVGKSWPCTMYPGSNSLPRVHFFLVFIVFLNVFLDFYVFLIFFSSECSDCDETNLR